MRELFAKLRQSGPGERKARSWLFWLGLAGMLLILLADLSGPGGPAKEPPEQDGAMRDYAAGLEQRLEQVLGQVDGAGRTRVMVTLDSTGETVYAEDRRSGDGVDETRHILLDGDDRALVEQVWQPEVRGVAVVCEGGGSVTVASRITELVSVLLGVPANRISVAKMS